MNKFIRNVFGAFIAILFGWFFIFNILITSGESPKDICEQIYPSKIIDGKFTCSGYYYLIYEGRKQDGSLCTITRLVTERKYFYEWESKF